jgi:hypothetical protein
MQIHSDPPSSTHNLTTRYIASLSAVAGLAIFGQVLVQQMLTQQTKDVQIISAAQDRQTLCQRVVKASMAVQLAQNPHTKQEQVVELQDAIAQWESSRQSIRKELRNTFSDAQMTEVQPILQKAGVSAEEITTSAQNTLKKAQAAIATAQRLLKKQTTRASAIAPSEESGALGLLQAEREYVRGVDQIISWHGE